MVNTLKDDLNKIQPSVKDALFRYLTKEPAYQHLYKNKSLIGFELILEKNKDISGDVLIAFKKHTIIVYKNDLDENFKLSIFPTKEQLRLDDFDIHDLYVRKCVYKSDTFKAVSKLNEGTLYKVAKDLISEKNKTDVPDFTRLNQKELIAELNENFYNKEQKLQSIKKEQDELLNKTIGRVEEKEAFEKELTFKEDLINRFNNEYFKNYSDIVSYCVKTYNAKDMVLEAAYNALLGQATFHALKDREQLFYFINLVIQLYESGRL